MKPTLLAAFVTVFLLSGLAPALAQRSEVLVQDGLRLPRSHHYEQYDRENASYGTVRLGTVADHVRRGSWIYDRTAEEWVSHPSVGTPNPRYGGSARDFRRDVSPPDRGVLAQDGLRLPRSHQYEQYDRENASYGVVRIGTVADHVRQGTWIYDRTAQVWVSHPSVGTPNPQYGTFGRDRRG